MYLHGINCLGHYELAYQHLLSNDHPDVIKININIQHVLSKLKEIV